MIKSTKVATSRLLSLDVFRGITIAGMILVNNPGNWGHVYAPLLHAEWNGLTPTDLVYPFFMFIMGISMYISYKKFDFKFSNQTFIKLLRRSILLFLIGLFLGWFGLFFRGLNALSNEQISLFQKIGQAATNFEHLRILGVLQRLAIVSFIGSLIVLLVRPKYIPWIIGFSLLSYWLIISIKDSFAITDNNIIATIDRSLIGLTHMYSEHLPDGSIRIFEPEGILSTLPCIAHVLIGFLVGKIISESKDNNERIQKIFISGTIILFLGFLLQYGFPINKKIWSSSFVLVTCGLGSLLFSLLIWIIDIKGNKRWSVFFESFGVNPLIIYALAGILSVLLNNLGFMYFNEWISTKSFIYKILINPLFGDYFGALVYALLFVAVNWLIGHILYKKKIYIKL
ncbi:MAG: DUF5009 domain-containing protein [Paludibacter sp.]